MYQDQGFFHEVVVSGVERALDTRLRELARYTNMGGYSYIADTSIRPQHRIYTCIYTV